MLSMQQKRQERACQAVSQVLDAVDVLNTGIEKVACRNIIA